VPADEPATQPLPDMSGWLGRSGLVVTSPAARCRVPGALVEPRLGPWDLGEWTGRPFEELDLAPWRSDPSFTGHGGESLVALSARVSALLSEWRSHSGRVAALTHAAVIRTAVVHALRAPLAAAWDIDVALGSLTELHTTPAGWRLVRLSCAPQAVPQP
jgi:broad specificity phosphatase PhoE